MLEREAILPLVLGALFAAAVHVGAAAALVQWREAVEPAGVDEPVAVDLAAEAVDVPEPRVAGQAAPVRYQIRNRGDRDAEAFSYVLRIEDEVLVEARAEEGLEAGQSTDGEIEHTVSRGGTYRLTLEVDPQGEMADADRSNNRLSRVFFWDVAEEQRAEGVDVAVADLRIGRPRIVGSPVTISGRVVNVGRSDAGVFNITLRVNGEAIEQRTVDGLAGGGRSERFVTRIYVDEPGEHAVTLEVAGPGLADDLDPGNHALTRKAEWKRAEDLEEPPVGQSAPSPVTINWISYEDYEDLLARQAEFDQAAVQPHVDPVEQATTPQDPTPPAPPQLDESTAPPPAPQVAPAPQPTQRVAEPEATPEQPTQPTVPQEVTEDAATAPVLTDLEAEQAAGPAEAEAGLPDPAEVATEEAPQVEPVTEATPSEEPVAASPEEATPAPEIAIATPDLELGEEADMLLPERSEQEADFADQRAPAAEVDPDADPTDRSLQVRVDELLDRREVTLPLDPEPEAESGSPQQEETEAEPDDRQTRTADRPVDPTQPLTDGAAEQAEPEQPVSPTQEPSQQHQPEEARPTVSPRDERESPPVSRVSDGARVVPGRVLAREGIEIRTVEPRFSDIARRTAIPRDPDVVITFNKEGEVVHAQIARSTGYANVDAPILASLYRWSATGEQLEQVDETFTMRLRILLGVRDDEDEQEEE